ncbi:MAG: hypothetical protein K8T20_10490 [Planctomycetes bacterium]|nr:hypothetical protein [Planctomycetota bacterium]
MLTGRRFVTIALVIGLCALAVTGCHRRSSKGSTTINKSDIFTTDEFPGAPVQAGNVADDQRAMSVSGSDVIPGSVRCVANGDRGTMIATYQVTGGRLYAHYYDGSGWTPPRALSALDCILTSASANTEVAFINTENSSSGFASDRNGDALIFWLASDAASSVTGDDANTNLWCTYFDVSHCEDIAANYGFQEFASRVSSLEDSGVASVGADEKVDTYGLISDGLCGEARWGFSPGLSGGGYADYRWGNETTDSIIVFWRQDQDNDPAAGYQQDLYMATARFDLTAAIDSEIPLTPGVNSRLAVAGFGASDGGTSSEETTVDTAFITYNNVLFYRITSTAVAGSGAAGVENQAQFTPLYGSLLANADINVQEVAFNLSTGTPSSPVTLQAIVPDSTSGNTFQCNGTFHQHSGFFGSWQVERNSTYGSDEGLAVLVNYSVQLVNDPDLTFGALTADGRLRLTEINEGTGAIVAGMDIDGEDPDITDPVQPSEFSTRISRNGDYIWAVWDERVDSSPTGVSPDDHTGLWVSCYVTTRIAEDGTFPIPPALGTMVSTAVSVETSITGGAAVNQWRFQEALGYICGVQSDPDNMSVVFQHSDTSGDTVWVTKLTANLVTPTASSFATAPLEGFEDGDLFGYGPVYVPPAFSFIATDSGEGGNVFTTYRKDTDFLVGPVDVRQFAEKTGVGGGQVEIDSSTTDRQVRSVVGDVQNIVTTPRGDEIGTFDVVSLDDDDRRANPAHFVHVLFFENRFNEVDGLPFALRTRMFNAEDTSITLGETFTPNAGTLFADPFQLDLPAIAPGSGTLDATALRGTALDGDTVGLFFTEGSRIYYQEANPGGNGNDEVVWLNNEGVSNPLLVDDDNDEEVQTIELFTTRSCTCQTLSGATIFWTKAFGSGSGGGFSQRLQVRVRE